jgi:hypothetical protein
MPSRFLPGIVAFATNVFTGIFVRFHQPDYPFRFVVFQAVVLLAASALAAPFRWAWIIAFLLLLGGVVISGFSVGLFYVPTLVTAGWVMVRRLASTAT